MSSRLRCIVLIESDAADNKKKHMISIFISLRVHYLLKNEVGGNKCVILANGLVLVDTVPKDAQSRAESVLRDKQVRERNIGVHLHHFPW